MRTIVVGVDGSPASLAALRFALGEARLRRTRLLALHAWVLPLTEAPGPFLLDLPSPAGPPVQELSADLGRAADALLAAALDEVAEVAEGVEVERRVVEGPAASMLVEASEGADLLVVGSRGHGGFHGLLLGSVSQQCAQHARCPVVIVPSPERVQVRAA
jgi:nucleotide-binding universal stress UspA family protein